jgi:hypothetical protein
LACALAAATLLTIEKAIPLSSLSAVVSILAHDHGPVADPRYRGVIGNRFTLFNPAQLLASFSLLHVWRCFACSRST